MHLPNMLDEVCHRHLLAWFAGTVVSFVVIDPWNPITYNNMFSFICISRGKPEDNMGRILIECL